MGRVLCIANQKGGVGKTTTAVNLAAALATAGKRTLLIDMDPQGSATSGLGARDGGERATSYDIIMGERPVRDAILPSQLEQLNLLPAHRDLVLRTLEKGLSHDHARTSVHDFSPLGLVEMTRKRTTESLERQLCEPCHECGGRGTLKTAETLTYEVFREITRAVRQFEASQLLVIASPKVVTKITEEESAAVAELEEFLGKSIRFQADEQYAQEQYDVVLL